MIAWRSVLSNVRLGVLALALVMTSCADPIPTARHAALPPGVTAAGPVDGVFTMADGARLPYRDWLPDGAPTAVVLALHGMNDSRDAWEIPAPTFAQAGIAVFSPDQRGFGDAPDRGRIASPEVMAEDAATMARDLRRRFPQARLVLMGESMGGAVLMRMAALPDTPKVDGIVLVAPAVWGRDEMNVFMRAGLWVMAGALPWMTATGSIAHVTPSDNHAALMRLSYDPLTIHDTRFDAVRGLVDLMDAAQSSAPALHPPVLLLYGGKDDLIPPHATAAAWRALPPGARTAFYPGGYHLLMRDKAREVVIGDVIAWIADPEAPLPSGAEQAAAAWLTAQK